MADDDGGGLDACDQTGIVHDAGVDGPASGSEEVPTQAKRVAGGYEDALPFQNEQREVMGGDVAEGYGDQAVNEESGQRAAWGAGQPAGNQAGGCIAAKHEGNEADEAECAEKDAGDEAVLCQADQRLELEKPS